MEINNLSVEQLQEQLSKIEQSKTDLEKALSQRWDEAKSELAQEIRDMVESRGYDIEEIAGLIPPRRRRGAGKKGNRSYVKYVDPEDESNVYSRGVLPRWMKEKMAAQGYDSSRKKDRESFKANYLRAVQD